MIISSFKKTELFKISYPGSTPVSLHVHHHHRLQP